MYIITTYHIPHMEKKKTINQSINHNHNFKASKIFFAISRYCHIPPATFLN